MLAVLLAGVAVGFISALLLWHRLPRSIQRACAASCSTAPQLSPSVVQVERHHAQHDVISVTPSLFAAACGIHPWLARQELWNNRRQGLQIRVSQEQQQAIDHGVQLEDTALQVYASLVHDGNRMQKPNQYVASSWCAASAFPVVVMQWPMRSMRVPDSCSMQTILGCAEFPTVLCMMSMIDRFEWSRSSVRSEAMATQCLHRPWQVYSISM
jgi:hypothetical protein